MNTTISRSSMMNIALTITFLAFLLDVVNGNKLTDASPVDAPLLTSKIAANHTITVDVNGGGDFKSVQAAIDSVPKGNTQWIIIDVAKGIYREKVQVPKDKPYIFMRGSGMGKTAIVWSQSSSDNYECATMKVEAPHFIAFGISFKNDAPTGIAYTSHNQSVAAYVGADKVAFFHCGFYSTHNTLFDHLGRHYYEECYIQGAIDFIFGSAQSIFHDCEIFVITDKRVEIHGSVTAHSRTSPKDNSGFVFLKGKVYGVGQVFLGRPVGDYSRVIFANTYLSKTVRPEGWTTWNHAGDTKNLYKAEYKCHGPGADTKERTPWSKKLSDKEAAPFLSLDFINAKHWLPASKASV